ILAITTLFYFTARDQNVITDVDRDPDLVVNVVGKQWSWDFNYVTEDVWDAGVHGYLDEGTEGVEEDLPTLYLPVDELVEFQLVLHVVFDSIWVPTFLYKFDIDTHHTTTFQITPDRGSTYAVKCAELCEDYHSAMLINHELIERAEYDAKRDELRDAGQTGQ